MRSAICKYQLPVNSTNVKRQKENYEAIEQKVDQVARW